MAALNDLLKVNTQPGARLNANASQVAATAGAGAGGAVPASGAGDLGGGAMPQAALVSNFVTVQSV
jgi:hypothetical protein